LETQGEINGLIVLGNIPKFSFVEVCPFVDYQYLGKSFLSQLAFGISFLRARQSKLICLIGGDVWLGGAQVMILSALFPSKTRTQISFHGIPNLTNNLILKVLRSLYLKILISRVDSIRVVSKSLLKILASKHEIESKKLFISPVPISIPSEIRLTVKSIEISVVGRLHPERGILESMQIFDLLASLDRAPSIHFFGDGPLKRNLQDWRDSHSSSEKIFLHGHLPNSLIASHLASTRILLSCAPEEGYGLSLREALVSGAYVVARSNSGTLELSRQFPNAVYLFENVLEAKNLILGLLANESDLFDPEDITKRQRALDEKSLKFLAKSWTE
jgi:glycosyltransferase involved in cell wall biosynthesis